MGDDYCGPPAPVSESDVMPLAAPSEKTSSCQDSCCDNDDAEPLDTPAPGQKSPTPQKPDDCCSAGKCADNKTENHTDAPDCCRGKVRPCCDTSCLNLLAMRECEMSATAASSPTIQPNTCGGATDHKACSQHSLSALDRYGATLQALGCICRALIALGQETCCEIRERRSLDGKQCSKKSSARSLRTSLDSCSNGSVTKDQAAQNRPRLRSGSRESTRTVGKASADVCVVSFCSKDKPAKELPNAASSGSCCEPPKQDTMKASMTGCADSRCTEKQPPNPQGSCTDACCSSAVPDPGLEIEEASTDAVTDIENRGTGKEHVILSISGMTCTGCETKLRRALATVPAVKDLKTSLVLSRAEFNIDLRLGSVEEIMKHLERTTEFKCARVQNQGSSLDLIVPDEPSNFIRQTWPDGVLDMAPIDRQTVRVAFDPNIVGARDLIEKIWGPPIKLASPRGDPSLEAGSKHVRHAGYMTLLSAVLTIPVLVMAWASLPDREVAYSSASLALATIVQVVVAGPFYPKALKALIFSRVIEMDLLIVLSTSAAYIFSVVSFAYLIAEQPLSTGQFFETSTLLVTLIMVGRWVAALARQRAVESISIRSLQASTAILVDQESGTEREIDARLLQYGDTFKVLPDTRIPTDGTVINGSSEVDESMLTGESRPVEKYPSSVVVAGSINGSGVMTVRLNRLPSDNTINTIAAMVDEAKLSKPKLQDLADRVASYFVPVVLVLTIITFLIWVALGMTVRGYDGSEATIRAITYAITVLIVSCPCAIGLAVPMVIVIASGVAAERGIIFKSADAIEVAHKTSHVVFDKTGTLTRGKLSVVASECDNVDKLPLLLGLIENSRHPVSVSVAAHLKDAGVMASAVPEPKSLTGKGVETTFGGRKLRAGNSRWLNLSDNEVVQPMLAQGYTVFCFTIDNTLQAVYGLEDELRPDAVGTIKTLQRRGVSVHVVSGDDDGAVQSLASKLSIPGDNVRSRSSPADKKDYIQTLLSTGIDRKKPIVVFCGDGTNDAVALAQATIGVHMNEGTDVAQSAADVVLMRPSLAGIPTMMDASRKSVNRIKFNFIWSFVYNTFAVLLAAGAFVNARIPPEFAGLGELVSVLPVIAAALLLRWSKI
ncbi:cation-transporting P-type ATPase PCA1 [Aspergillus fumigatus Af293]|uniref:Copper-transporting ATPase, putative n=1 Tax=Aspergillus fumigatus (strain ATCC MYA-4609 / CBS 101355 / FGSC A1100 / Af293) TaxID=330879 RepID=Q4WRJ0_ASPFU|nr:copper-transporting ATPase, putative [Aspergillus fumigatus Af293]EAL90942.1 copper-transporting ATPase, putative [Aspergillus fumigatus Af293]